MHGHDMSNYQTLGEARSAYLGGDTFGVYKASEGLGFVDGMHKPFVDLSRSIGALTGHYHFAHIENAPEDEAHFFLGAADWRVGEALILDYEPYGQTGNLSHTEWVLRFKRYIQKVVGITPWLYCDRNMGMRIAANNSIEEDVELHEMPLWIAIYEDGKTPSSWLTWPKDKRFMWQYTDKPHDSDIFFFDEQVWINSNTPGDDMPSADEVARAVMAAMVPNTSVNVGEILLGTNQAACAVRDALFRANGDLAKLIASSLTDKVQSGVDPQALANEIADVLAKRLSS